MKEEEEKEKQSNNSENFCLSVVLLYVGNEAKQKRKRNKRK